MRKPGLLLLVLAAATPACKGGGGGEASDRNQVQVRAMRVETAEMKSSVPTLHLRLPGEVEGRRDSLLASTLGGYVERVLVEKGQEVKAGTSLAYVNKSIQDAQLAQARAAYEQAKADQDRATQAAASLSRSRRDAVRFAYEQAEAAYRMARIHAERSVIRAPFDGVVAELHVEEGEVVSPGGEVARLVQLDPVIVSLSVADRDVVNLKEGLDVQVTPSGGGEILPGVIKRVNAAANVDSRAFVVEVEVDNTERKLLPGMIAKVDASVRQEGEALTLPQYVLVTRKDANGVFVVREGKAFWREVELGSLIRDQVIVSSGVEVGDHVVVTGHRDLADQDAIIVTRQGICCTDGRVVFEDDESTDGEHASAP